MSKIEIQTLLQNTPNLIAVLDGEWNMEIDCSPYTASSPGIKFLSSEISGSIRGEFIKGSVERDGTIELFGAGFRFNGNVKDWHKGKAVGTISHTGGKCSGTWILIKKEAPNFEVIRLAAAEAERKRKEEEARLITLEPERKRRVGSEIPQASLGRDNIVVKKQKSELDKKYIVALDGLWNIEANCPPYGKTSSSDIEFSSGVISGNIEDFLFSGSVDVDGIISGYATGEALFKFQGNISDWKKGEARGTLADTGGHCSGNWILTKKEAPNPEATHLAALAEETRLANLKKKRKAEARSAKEARLARLKEKREAEERRIAQERAAEEARLAKLKEKREAEERRIAQERDAEETRLAKLKEERKAEERRIARERAAEEARLAKLKEEREAEERRIAQERAAEKRRKALYDAIVSAADAELANLQDYISINPETPGLMEIVTDVAAVKAALDARKESAIKRALVSLRATLSKEKSFIDFQKEKEQKLQRRRAAERRYAEEKRRREAAEAKRRKEELERKLAAQVNREREKLKTHAIFLKRQVATNIVSNSTLAQALVPVIKSLEGGISSNDLSGLEALNNKASDAIKEHGLVKQYTEVQNLMAMAQAAQRNQAEAQKVRKEEEKRLAVKKKTAALVAAKRAKERAAKRKHEDAFAKRQEKRRYDIAVIIGNRNYSGGTPKVDFAHNDAGKMKQFVVDQLGYRTGNVLELRDTTKAQLEAVFGNNKTHKGKLNNWVRPGKSSVIVFYSGHGTPGLKDRRGYLLPVDADPNLVELNGYPVDTLYKNLNKIPAKSITVYLDACFSGDSPRGMIIRSTSGISVQPIIPKKSGNLTILTAARGDQFASWDEKAKLGLFTRYLLDALKGAADGAGYGNRDRKVTVAEVKKYLSDEMTYQARRLYSREQNPTVKGKPNRVLSVY